uniref:Uncharacterized protein n=1 Tax=Setaria viridis TaxID=4556 RepID=A0A4U6VCX0_SETVI|nr:hypothetical protein SEVIR_4G147300v2 [Setaria viridis]
MGRKVAASKAGKGEKKKRSDKKKEPQLLAPKFGKTDQTAPPNPVCVWKWSTLKEEDIKALVAEKFTLRSGIHQLAIYIGNACPLETCLDETMRETMSSQYLDYELDEPKHGDCLQVPELVRRIIDLKEQGLTGLGVAFSFMKRLIQLLQQRCHLGYEYTGLDDPSRFSPDEIIMDEIMARLRRMFKNVSGIPTIVWEFNASHLPKPEGMIVDDQEEEVVESSSSTSSDTAEKYEVEARQSVKDGSSSKSSNKHFAVEELEAAIPLPLKKKRTIIVKWAVKKSIAADNVPPKVLDEATKAEKAAAMAAQNKSPITKELIEVEDDPEPQYVIQVDPQVVNPAGANTTQAAEMKLKPGQDPIVDVQATPKASSSTVKPL